MEEQKTKKPANPKRRRVVRWVIAVSAVALVLVIVLGSLGIANAVSRNRWRDVHSFQMMGMLTPMTSTMTITYTTQNVLIASDTTIQAHMDANFANRDVQIGGAITWLADQGVNVFRRSVNMNRERALNVTNEQTVFARALTSADNVEPTVATHRIYTPSSIEENVLQVRIRGNRAEIRNNYGRSSVSFVLDIEGNIRVDGMEIRDAGAESRTYDNNRNLVTLSVVNMLEGFSYTKNFFFRDGFTQADYLRLSNLPMPDMDL